MFGKAQLDETTRELRHKLNVSDAVSINDLAKVVGARAECDITIDAYDFECSEIYGVCVSNGKRAAIRVRVDALPRHFMYIACHELAHALEGDTASGPFVHVHYRDYEPRTSAERKTEDLGRALYRLCRPAVPVTLGDPGLDAYIESL
jgi:hypothetical protein